MFRTHGAGREVKLASRKGAVPPDPATAQEGVQLGSASGGQGISTSPLAVNYDAVWGAEGMLSLNSATDTSTLLAKAYASRKAVL